MPLPVPPRPASPEEPVVVPAELGRKPLDAVVRALFQLSWNEARERIRTGKIAVNGAVRAEPLYRVLGGAEVVMSMRAPKKRADLLPDEAVVFVDAHVIVIDKPAGVSTVPFEEGEKGALDERVRHWLSRNGVREERGARPSLGVVHRLDKETTGLVVFARSWLAKKSLSSQFRAHTTERRYLALANGAVASRTFRSHLMANRGDGLRGSHKGAERRGRDGSRGEPGQLAITHVEALEPLNAATLVACVLETGRTHQIRIHLSEAGHPLVGERVYIRGFEAPLVPAPRLMLHATRLGFVHPKTGEHVRWDKEPPKDFEETLSRLRTRPSPAP